ncbi:MAG: 50S ribosomal protein L30 [Chloroflexota bacterium]|nr:50S ribosomal protein L30 [Chloroflexota bacterium]
MAAKLRMKYVKSAIGYSKKQKETIRALGFRHLNETVERDDNAVIRGMVNKVRHLLEVEEIES